MVANPNKYNIKLEPELREEMGAICDALGMTISGAMNVFARVFVMHSGFPFAVRIPDECFGCDCCECDGCCHGHCDGLADDADREDRDLR